MQAAQSTAGNAAGCTSAFCSIALRTDVAMGLCLVCAEWLVFLSLACNAVACLDISVCLHATGCADSLPTDCDFFDCRWRAVTNAVHVARGAQKLALRSAQSLCRPWYQVRTSVAPLSSFANVRHRFAGRHAPAVGAATAAHLQSLCSATRVHPFSIRGACMLQRAASHRCAESAVYLQR